MPVDWQRITAKGTSVRALVTVALTIALCVAFLACVGGMLYILGHPENAPKNELITMVNSIIVLFAATVNGAVQSYFHRSDRTGGGGENGKDKPNA